MVSVNSNNVGEHFNKGKLKIIMEVINWYDDLSTLIEIHKGGVIIGSNKVGKELKYEFSMVVGKG